MVVGLDGPTAPLRSRLCWTRLGYKMDPEDWCDDTSFHHDYYGFFRVVWPGTAAPGTHAGDRGADGRHAETGRLLPDVLGRARREPLAGDSALQQRVPVYDGPRGR